MSEAFQNVFTQFTLHFQTYNIFSILLLNAPFILYWCHFIHLFLFSELIQKCIPVLFDFTDSSYNCSFDWFRIPSYSHGIHYYRISNCEDLCSLDFHVSYVSEVKFGGWLNFFYLIAVVSVQVFAVFKRFTVSHSFFLLAWRYSSQLSPQPSQCTKRDLQYLSENTILSFETR